MEGLSLETMEFIISRLIERGGKAVAEAKENPTDSFLKGRKMAYYEMLDIVKNELTIHDADLKSMGMDFDVEEKILFG